MDILIQEAVLNLQSAREQVSDISQEFKIWRLLSLETGFQSDNGHIQRGILLQNELAACRNTLQLCIKTLNLLIKKKNLDLGSSGESLVVAGVKRRQTDAPESEIEEKANMPEAKRSKVVVEVDQITKVAPIAQKQAFVAADDAVALAAESSAPLPEPEKQIARDEKDIIYNDLAEVRSMDHDDDQEEVSHEIHDDSVSVLLDSLDSNHVKEDQVVDEDANDAEVEDPEKEQDDAIVDDADIPESIQHAQNESEPLATLEELQTHETQPSSPKEPSDDERDVDDVQLQVPTQEQPAEQEREENTQSDAEEIAVAPTEEAEAEHVEVQVKATVADDEEEVSKEQDIEEHLSADEQEIVLDVQEQEQSVSDKEDTQEQEMLNVEVEDEELDNAASEAEVLVDSIVSEVPVADEIATDSTDEALSDDEDEEEEEEEKQEEAEENKENAVMTKNETDGSNPFVLATQEEQEADISDVQELNGAASESDAEPEKSVDAAPEERKDSKKEMSAPKSILKNSPVKTAAKASKSKKKPTSDAEKEQQPASSPPPKSTNSKRSRQALKEQPEITTATSQPHSHDDNLSPFSKATAHLAFPPKLPAMGKKGLRSSKTFQSLSQITIERVRSSIAAPAPASVPAKKVHHVLVSEDDDGSDDSDSDDSSSSGGDDTDKIRSVKQVRKKSKRRKSMFQRLADDGMFQMMLLYCYHVVLLIPTLS